MISFRVSEDKTFSLVQDTTCQGLNAIIQSSDSVNPSGNIVPNLHIGSRLSVISGLGLQQRGLDDSSPTNMLLRLPASARNSTSKSVSHEKSMDSIASYQTAQSTLDESAQTSTFSLAEADIRTVSQKASEVDLRASPASQIVPKKAKSQQFFTSLDANETLSFKERKSRIAITKSLLSKTNANASSWFTAYRPAVLDLALLQKDPSESRFLFNFCASRSLVTVDPLSTTNVLARLTLKSYITCHDVRQHSPDIIIGLASGELMLYNAIDGKYLRYNKQGYLNFNQVTCVKWVNHTLFLAGYSDGQVILFDKNRTDVPTYRKRKTDASLTSDSEPDDSSESRNSTNFSVNPAKGGSYFRVNNAVSKSSRYNPVEVWTLAPPSRPNTSCQFTKPSIVTHIDVTNQMMAAVTLSRGLIYIISISQNAAALSSLNHIFFSRFAGFMCCRWSPDGRFVACGGQDDSVSIFDARGMVALCDGHDSWVNDLAFDTTSDSGIPMLLSVGEDRKLIFWEMKYLENITPFKYSHKPYVGSAFADRATVLRIHPKSASYQHACKYAITNENFRP
eukprot:Partr_v1_DN28725_c1_g1_i3_m62424 putative wd repeat